MSLGLEASHLTAREVPIVRFSELCWESLELHDVTFPGELIKRKACK